MGLILASALRAGAEQVTFLKMPDHGVQPQTLTDSKGTLHVIFLAGAAAESDVFHSTLDAASKTFSKPQRVNHSPGNAMAIGSIRGAQVAIGRGDRLHIVWNGSVPSPDGKRRSDVLYTRSDGKGGFETERPLMHVGQYLDGGCTIAADDAGHVHAMWHATPVDAAPKAGEAARVVYVSTSADDGASFTEEKPEKASAGGVCGCCSMRATAAPGGGFVALYRKADGADRGMQMLTSKNSSGPFLRTELQPWPVNICPMSSSYLLPVGKAVLAAWETDGTIWMAEIGGGRPSPTKVSGSKSKHPTLARNDRGETLIAWAVGTGWQRGGTVAWSLLDARGEVIDGSRSAGNRRVAGAEAAVPVWSYPAAAWVKGLGFVVLH